MRSPVSNSSHRRRRVAVLTVAAVVLSAGCGGQDGRDGRSTRSSGHDTTGQSGADGSARACVGSAGSPRTIRYDERSGVDPNQLSLDVYRPKGVADTAVCPVIVFVHGGAWRAGDKAKASIDTKAAWAGRRGAVLVSVNYRLAPPGGSAAWPDFGNDVAGAVAYVVDHADELGIDPGRVSLIGHSAGAHLVSIVATHPALLADHGLTRESIRCVVSLDTASDDLVDPDPLTSRLISEVFGDEPAVRSDASPLHAVETSPGPVADMLLVTRGRPARQSGVERFGDALRAAGDQVTIIDANPLTHAEVNAHLGEPDDDIVTPAVESFLDGCDDHRN